MIRHAATWLAMLLGCLCLLAFIVGAVAGWTAGALLLLGMVGTLSLAGAITGLSIWWEDRHDRQFDAEFPALHDRAGPIEPGETPIFEAVALDMLDASLPVYDVEGDW
jgi:hypothetical protein